MLKLKQTPLGIAQHLIVISYDAFSEDNWEMASSLPALLQLKKQGAYTTKLKSVYPTLTYVVHSTMVTGVYPDKHGIIHNNHFQPFVREKDQSWYWFKQEMKVPAIYDLVNQSNMSTAGILWPVTGKASIKYNLPEIAAIKNENQALKIFKNGNPLYCLGMELKFGRYRKGIQEPYLDDFSTRCAVDTILRKKPNLLLLHLVDLDDCKHKHGTDNKEISRVIKRMDARLGRIMKAVEEAGIIDETVFLVVGDHGQFNVRNKVHLNKLLKEQGLIYEEKGALKWRAYFQSCGGSAYLYIKQGDLEAEAIATDLIKDSIKNDRYGIECLYSRDELDDFHVDKKIKYMVEAKVGYSFDDRLNGENLVNLDHNNITYATHGYSPDKKGYRCNLIISGKKIKQNMEFGDVAMVDLAPTMAKILGVTFDSLDGRVLEEIFS
ncbi:MAG: alkaline phosphatase family protein [Velocimicrobium sp.]